MVKVQKPIPKSLEKKTKLDNPIKQNKQKLKKEKSSKENKAKFIEDTTPVKEAKNSLKPAKEVIGKNKKNKELNGDVKSSKKLLLPAAASPPEQKIEKSKKKKNVAQNGLVEQAPKPVEVPQKLNKKEKIPKSERSVPVVEESTKPAKKSKKDKSAIQNEPSPAPPIKEELKKEKKTKKGKVTPQEEVNSAPTEDEPKKSGKKSKLAAEVKAPIVEEPTKTSKKDKKSKPVAGEAVAPPIVQEPQQSGKKAKNAKSSAQETATSAPSKVNGAQETPAPVKSKKNKNNKKSPKSQAPAVDEKSKQIQKPKKALQKNKQVKSALKNQQNVNKNAPKKEKPNRPAPTFRYDPIPYDEEKFNSIVNAENIKKIAELLKETVEKEVQKKKSSIFDDYRYFLNVANFKIASCPKRMVKLNLKHALVDKDDDVLLVVPDMQRGAKVDYEQTKQHWDDVLRENGVKGITVMPMNQLRKEHSTFEAKRKLCASYEHFMCDGRISGLVTAKVGKFTQKPRNTFHTVRLNEGKDIKAEIEKSLKKTAFRQLTKGSLQTIPVGTHKFTSKQLADNILYVLEQLKTIFPGGLGNVRSLHLRIGLVGTSSLPLYISMGQAPDETPIVIGLKEKRMLNVKREANEVLSKFAMTKDGKMVKLTKSAVEKKRKLKEMATIINEDENGNGKPSKKSKKDKKETKSKKTDKEVNELELPENEENEEEDDESSDDGDDIALGQASDGDESEDDGAEGEEDVVENGLVGEDDEESEEDDEEAEDDDDDDDEDESD